MADSARSSIIIPIISNIPLPNPIVVTQLRSGRALAHSLSLPFSYPATPSLGLQLDICNSAHGTRVSEGVSVSPADHVEAELLVTPPPLLLDTLFHTHTPLYPTPSRSSSGDRGAARAGYRTRQTSTPSTLERMDPAVVDRPAESRPDRQQGSAPVSCKTRPDDHLHIAPASSPLFSTLHHLPISYLEAKGRGEEEEEPNIDAVPSSLLYPQPRPFAHIPTLPLPQLQLHPLLQQSRPLVADISDDLHLRRRASSRARSPIPRASTTTPARQLRSASESAGTAIRRASDSRTTYTHNALERVKSADRTCPCACGVAAFPSSSTVTVTRTVSLPPPRTTRPTITSPPGPSSGFVTTARTSSVHRPPPSVSVSLHSIASPASPPIPIPGLCLSPSEPVTPERSNYFATLYPADYPGYKSPPRSLRSLPKQLLDEQEILTEDRECNLAYSQPGSRKNSMSGTQLKRKVVIMGAPSVGE